MLQACSIAMIFYVCVDVLLRPCSFSVLWSKQELFARTRYLHTSFCHFYFIIAGLAEVLFLSCSIVYTKP